MPGPDPLTLNANLQSGDPDHPQGHNDERLTINQIIALLGVDPEGQSYDTIAERLDDLSEIYATSNELALEIEDVLTNSQNYTDGQVAAILSQAIDDATNRVATAKAEAIASADVTAQGYADTAEANAEAAAETYADTEVSAAISAHGASLSGHSAYLTKVYYDSGTGWPDTTGLQHPALWYGPEGSNPDLQSGWQSGDIALTYLATGVTVEAIDQRQVPLFLGSKDSPLSSASTARPDHQGPITWIVDSGVVPTNALGIDTIVTTTGSPRIEALEEAALEALEARAGRYSFDAGEGVLVDVSPGVAYEIPFNVEEFGAANLPASLITGRLQVSSAGVYEFNSSFRLSSPDNSSIFIQIKKSDSNNNNEVILGYQDSVSTSGTTTVQAGTGPVLLNSGDRVFVIAQHTDSASPTTYLVTDPSYTWLAANYLGPIS